MEPSDRLPGESLVTVNSVFLLDLRSGNPLRFVSNNVRKKLTRAPKLGAVLIDDRSLAADSLKRLYPETMRRVKAGRHYEFSAATLERWALDPSSVVLAASLGDTVEAVSLFCVAGRTAEYHLNASSIRGRELTAQLIAGAITRLASASVGLLTRRRGASRRWALPIQAEVQRNAQAGASRVLDLGCGTGTIAIALAGDVTGRVVGVAAPAGMLQVAKEKSESFEWVRGTCDYPRGRAGRPRRMLLRHPSVPAARRRSAAGVRRRRRAIAPKGVFAFDIYQPNLDYLRTPQTIASPGP